MPSLLMLAPKRSRSYFTLIELLVVIAIIAILASLLLPALRSAKDRGILAYCLNNQKQLYVSASVYGSDSEEYPATSIPRSGFGTPWCDSGEQAGNGQYAFTLLIDNKYTIESAAKCPASKAGYANIYAFNTTNAWYHYNGPSAAARIINEAGHNSNLQNPVNSLNLGWHSYGWGVYSTLGISYNDHGNSVRRIEADDTTISRVTPSSTFPDQRAFFVCPNSLYCPPTWPANSAAWEPHGGQPMNSDMTASISQRCVTGYVSLPVFRRNACYVDGSAKQVFY